MIDEILLKFVKQFEGFSEKAFWDYGQWTVGWGCLAKSSDEIITPKEADARLIKELQDSQEEIIAADKNKKFQLNQNQIDALTSFNFNTGKGVYVINECSNPSEIPGHLLQYNRAGGEVIDGLVKRRQAEADLFNTV